ncbi:MAG: hypothetical protein IT161_22730 [Bryobacterales bacterium]|nr:hypothetical protein [Bryobacterales bacterium]
MPCFLLVADDHTGACDAGAAFADEGWPVEVYFDASPPAVSDGTVHSISLDVRRREAESARRRTRDFCCSLPHLAAPLFIKIDSTLAEGSAAFLAEVYRAIGPRRMVVAPANPAQGRLIVDGELIVHGEPTGIRLKQWLGSLSGVRYCDAQTEADLAAVLDEAGDAVLAGSAGLAKAMARKWKPAGTHTPPKLALAREILVVAGSHQAVTREQVEVLRAAHLAGTSIISAASVSAIPPDWLTAGHALLVVGGDTLAQVTGHFGVVRVTLHGELVPGVAIGSTPNGAVLASKPGGFGHGNTLVDTVRFLRCQA